MKIVKSHRSDDNQNLARDAEHARLRMIYENQSDYAEWRLRMGLQKPTEGWVDPAMRARVSALFAELSRSLAARDICRRAPRWKDMTPAQAADQLAALPDRFAAPVTGSDELRGQFESADF